jgi:mRNA interferase MazF
MVYTPGQPDDRHQPRPALVVSENIRNRLRDDVIVVPLFSRGKSGPTRVTLHARSGGIRGRGVLYCEEITTIDRDFIHRGPLGPLVPRAILEAVSLGVRRALGESIPEVV